MRLNTTKAQREQAQNDIKMQIIRQNFLVYQQKSYTDEQREKEDIEQQKVALQKEIEDAITAVVMQMRNLALQKKNKQTLQSKKQD